jgi:uncharacterized iron-regulated membrane protein
MNIVLPGDYITGLPAANGLAGVVAGLVLMEVIERQSKGLVVGAGKRHGLLYQ